uniref:HECT domain-containing protein n=1 Tax=Parastrongyloides trichosuri TaxID=131310 RepID=A0A0N4ZY66_PARTI
MLNSSEMKRKQFDDIFVNTNKKNNIFVFKNKLNGIIEEKNLYIEDQRRASLMIPPYGIDSKNVQGKFGLLVNEINQEDLGLKYDEKRKLLDHIFKESIITEWPKEITEGERKVEIDCAPLIHKARTVKKCRTQHPTLRVKVCGAIKDDTNTQTTIKTLQVQLILRKFKNDERDDTGSQAGHLMLTQREGASTYRAPPSPLKFSEDNGILKCIMKNPKTLDPPNGLHQLFMNPSIGFGNNNSNDSNNNNDNNLLYENDILTGMKIFSMTDRRALTTRYVLEVDVEITFVDGHQINHKVFTNNFLIAITNDQTEALLNSIFWSRLASPETCTTSRLSEKEDVDAPFIKYGILKIALQNFMKAQINNARELDEHELLHIQCMLFLPRFINITKEEMLIKLQELYTISILENIDVENFTIQDVKSKLLTDFVSDTVNVDRKEFMNNQLVSLTDCSTILTHTLWNWFYKTFEMIADIGHKLCTSTQAVEKKLTKSRKISYNSQSSATVEESVTMLWLFNQRLITFTSRYHSYNLLKTRSFDTGRGSMMLRFCEDNQGFISIIFDHKDGKPRIGSVSCEKIKDNKNGLLGILMEVDYPQSFEYILKIDSEGPLSASKEVKSQLFCQYQLSIKDNKKTIINDQLFTSVNPLSGEEVRLF